jgi:hypothetical protein
MQTGFPAFGLDHAFSTFRASHGRNPTATNMKTKEITLILLTMGIAGTLCAQDPGEIHGKVLDPDGGPVPYCTVVAKQGNATTGTETDLDGRFVLKPLAPGTYDVEVRSMALGTAEITGVRVDPGLLVRLKDITLNSTLGTVHVTGWREPLIRVEDPSRMVMTQTQIKTNALRKDPVKMITSMTPGVTRAHGSDELYFRGSRAGAMAYYVDGVKVTSSNPGVPPDAINSISVYTGGLPAKYGDVTGGVVAIETKSYFDLWQQYNAGR